MNTTCAWYAQRMSMAIFLCMGSVSGAWAQASDLGALEQQIRELYPDWRQRDVDVIIEGVAVALDDVSDRLTPEKRQYLIGETLDRVQSIFRADHTPVSAEFPFFAETYRLGVENYVAREPLSSSDQEKLAAQVDEIYTHAVALLADAGLAENERAIEALERANNNLSVGLKDPFSSSLKRPFTAEEMQRIIEEMDVFAADFATPQTAEDYGPPYPAVFVTGLFGAYGEIESETMPPYSEKMLSLSKLVGDQRSAVENEKLKKTWAADEERRRIKSEADQRELDLLRKAQRAQDLGRAAVADNDGPVVVAASPESPQPISVKVPPTEQEPSNTEQHPSWRMFVVSVLATGVVVAAGLWAYRRRLHSV